MTFSNSHSSNPHAGNEHSYRLRGEEGRGGDLPGDQLHTWDQVSHLLPQWVPHVGRLQLDSDTPNPHRFRLAPSRISDP